jgi:hypothetical protein
MFFASTRSRRLRAVAESPSFPSTTPRLWRWLLVDDHFAVDKSESGQCRYGLVEAVSRETRGERLAEFFSPLAEQEQRDRLRR